MTFSRSTGMVKKMIRLLKDPFPYFKNEKQMIVLVTSCIFLVLTIVQHFAFGKITLPLFTWFVGGFTAISTVCTTIILYFFPVIFKRFFDKTLWTRGKYFVFTMLLTFMIGLANTLYEYFLFLKIYYNGKVYYNDINFFICLYKNIITAFLVGIVPSVFGYFYLKKQELQSILQEKEEQNRKLYSHVQIKYLSDEKTITLLGNSKDSLTLLPQELFYIESSNNYVQVYYKRDEQILQKTLRTTLLQMEVFLSEYQFLVRCHRAFIVNVYQIEKIKGSKLWLKLIETAIPISRTYKANIPK